MINKEDIRIYWKSLDGDNSLYRIIIIIPNNEKNYKTGDRFIVKEYIPNLEYSIIKTNYNEKIPRYLEVIDVDDKYFYILTYSDFFSESEKEGQEVQEIKDYITKNLL